MADRQARVLVVRLGAMGDVLHALPAVAMLREALPGTNIGWIIEERWRELLCSPGSALSGARSEGRPLVDEVHLVDTRAWRKDPLGREVRQQVRSVLARLRAGQYSAALDVQGAIKSALLARISGARCVFGFAHPRESLARLFYSRRVEARAAHVIEQNLQLARAWIRSDQEEGGPCSCAVGGGGDPAVDLSASLQPQARAALLPRDARSEDVVSQQLHSLGLAGAPLAILNPGAGWAAKQWPVERYGQLATVLGRRGMQVVINYGPGEKSLAAAVAAAAQQAALPLRTSLSEFIALARRAKLFVGGDTGPMHLAALLGVETVALFGPTDPARNGPYWPGTTALRDRASATSYSHKRTCDAGLERLSVERVLAEIDALLQS